MMEGWLPEGGGTCITAHWTPTLWVMAWAKHPLPQKCLRKNVRHFPGFPGISNSTPPRSLSQQSPGKKAYVPPRTFLT